jgi:hypothetical protein
MKLDINTVYTFKMNSGEEMVARVNDVQDHIVWVTAPVSVAPAPQGMGLVPSLFTANPNVAVAINMQCVALYAPTEENVCSKYIEATTGIKVPEKKILVG